MDPVIEELERLAGLLDRGLLTREQFEAQRDRLLAGAGSSPGPSASPVPPEDAAPIPLPGAGGVSDQQTALPGGAAPGPGSSPPAAGGLDDWPERLGSYRVLGVLGAGGMGTVLRARHSMEGWAKKQGGDVAIKLIHPHIAEDPSFQSRFFDEAALGRRIQHPHLAAVHDVIHDGPWLGAVMELVEGERLSERVREGGCPPAEAVALLGPLAAALDHLHGQGIVHRDVKPANITLRADGTPVLLDLGIAKDRSAGSGDGRTQALAALGTTRWMAPEQAVDATSTGPAADQYALGMVAYALLAGRLPWEQGLSDAGVMVLKGGGRLEPLSGLRPDLAPGLSAAVMKALAPRPEERWASCSELPRRLGELLDPEALCEKILAALQEQGGYWTLVALHEGEQAEDGSGRLVLGIGTEVGPAKPKIHAATEIFAERLALDGHHGSELPDLSILAGLGTLTELANYECKVFTDLSPLADLTGLTHLQVHGAGLTDLSPLAGLTGLTHLDIGGGVSDLSPVAGLTGLTHLNMECEDLTDLSPLAALASLTELTFCYADVTDLSALSGLRRLRKLHTGLWSCASLTDLSPLEALTGLEDLLLTLPKVTDLSPLSGLRSLRQLSLWDCDHVTDLSALSGLTSLEKLSLLGAKSLRDLSVLSGLSRLTSFDLQGSKLTNLRPLSSLTELRTLLLRGNPSLVDLSALSRLASLTILDLGVCEALTDVSALSGLVSLHTLHLDYCEGLRDVSALSGLKSLETLSLHGCKALPAALQKRWTQKDLPELWRAVGAGG